VTIIAARPSVGKTAFALNVAYNAARNNPISVGIFSLEMPSEQLIRRLIATDATVGLDHIQTGNKYLTSPNKDGLNDLKQQKKFQEKSLQTWILSVNKMG
jgi:replicative DNA helicase